MKTPPFLLGAALLFWGWQTGLLWVGAATGLLLESSHWVRARWRFSQADLDRVWNLCVALFLGATLYAFFSTDSLTAVSGLWKDNSASSRLATINQSKRSLFQLLQWLPLLFIPIVLAQAFGERPRLDLSTFSLWLRRKRTEPGYAQRYPFGLNVTYPFFACCLFGASAGNERTLWFSAGLVALVTWGLWGHRSRGYNPAAWAASLLLALGFGVLVHLGSQEVQKALQRLDEALLVRWGSGRQFNAREHQTQIGAVGRLRLSGRIVLRVTPGQGPPPPLLREASYDSFHAVTWQASKRDFEHVLPDPNASLWVVQETGRASGTATIAGSMPGGSGLLAVPSGLSRIAQLPAAAVKTNHFGSVRVEDGPGFVQFQTTSSDVTVGSPPGELDLSIPLGETATIHQIAQELGLMQLAPEQAVRAVEQFFADRFTYSVEQGPEHRRRDGRSALSRFLLEHRTGHCEYFGTATVLLLRAAHIPARYAVGYSLQEKRGRTYLVRERHGHAWCQAWIDGAWRDVDTTPADWAALESRNAPFWEPVRDLFSRIWFEFNRWRWGHAEWKRYLLWLIVPVLGFALARLLLQRQWGRAQPTGTKGFATGWPGHDSEFYQVEQRLARAGLDRQPGETGRAWLRRVAQSSTIPAATLSPLLAAHYRLRFDPRGLNASERAQLRQEVGRWLDGAH